MANQGPDFSIAHRLALGFGAVLLLVALQAGLTLNEQWQIAQQEAHLSAAVRPAARAAVDVHAAYLRQAVSIRGYALLGTERSQRSILTARQDARAALMELERLPLDEMDRSTLASLVVLGQRYDAEADRFLALVRQNPDPTAWVEQERALTELREQLTDQAQALAASQERKQTVVQAEVDAALARITTSFGVTAGLILVASVLAAVLTARSVREPAQRLVQAARALGRGEYAPALALHPDGAGDGAASDTVWRDELRTLSHALSRTAGALERRDRRVLAHAQVADVLASSLDAEQLARSTLREVATYAGAEVGVLYALDSDEGRLRPLATHALQGVAPLALGEGIPGQAAERRASVVVQDIPADTPFRVRFGVDEVPPRAIAAVPVAAGPSLLGVLVVGSVRDFSTDALDFTQSAAQQLAVSLQNALAHQRLADLAADLQDKNEELAAQNEEILAQTDELSAQTDELSAQNEELQAQREALLEADRQKDEFLAIATHELKSPMTSVKGYAQLLQRRLRDKPGLEEVTDALNTIEEQTNRIVSRVDRMLDASRARMGRLQLRLEPVDLCTLVRQQAQQAQARSAAHRIESAVPEAPVTARGDAGYLEQVLGNLLDNAIRYSPDGGEIQVTLERVGDEAHLAVKDQGIGIPEDALPQLFQPYFRHAEAKQVTAKGMGIGLYVTHQIVTVHGGRITVTSAPGEGTTFAIALPLSGPPVAPAGQPDGIDAHEGNGLAMASLLPVSNR